MTKEKGFRDGIDKKSLMKSMTDEDWERIKKQKDLDKVEPGTPIYDLVLYQDDIRRAIREKKSLIEKRIWNIQDIKNQMTRLKTQLLKGDITEELKNGVPMNEAEVNSTIQHQKWIIDGEVRAISQVMAELLGFAGHTDVSRAVVLERDEFVKYMQSIEERLKGMGYELFS